MDILKTFSKYLLLLLLPLVVFAQNSPSPYHRFGLVLSRGSGVSANIVPYANITVCVAGSNPCAQASIYNDVGLTSPILGPVVADPNGNFAYYLSGNQCVDEYYTSPNITAYTMSNVCSSYGNNNTGSSTNGQALVNIMNSVGGRDIADGGTIATLTTVLPLTGGILTGTLTAPTIHVTGRLTTPSFTINGGTPITSQSSTGNQVVTCPPGGAGNQYCDAAGAWTNPGSYTLPPPTISTLGGIFSSTAPTNRFASGVDVSGNVVYTQPTYANLGGSVPIWNQNTTGNSGTTNSFASVPSNCGAGASAYGIDSSGNALCNTTQQDEYWTFVGCAAPGDGPVYCSNGSTSLPTAMPDTSYSVTCIAYWTQAQMAAQYGNAHQVIMNVSASVVSTTQISSSVGFAPGDSGTFPYSPAETVSCHAHHN